VYFLAMGKKDPRVDDYIVRAAPFARPILKRLRKIVHTGCPAVEETIKWNSPFFERKGIICFMAAFKEHCAFGFWKGSLIFGAKHKGAMGHFGRITSISDLPNAKTLTGYVRKAAELNEAGVRKSRPRPRAKQKVAVPADLKAALQKNAKARKTFENFSYSHKKEYVDWIKDAKRDETRARRLQTTIQWLAQGKPQNWKYL
jgi:uncharacterized protein YdeI (YjbR/CyaY-like superfamily)